MISHTLANLLGGYSVETTGPDKLTKWAGKYSVSIASSSIFQAVRRTLSCKRPILPNPAP